MDTHTLKIALDKAGINPNWYSIGKTFDTEILVLTQEDSGWFVYYVQRGERAYEEKFSSEADACDSFFNQIIKWK